MSTKPVIFTLDDEPEVLQAIDMDLRRQYGADYRIMRANSGIAALETLKKLKLRSEAVALFVVDQRMPHMTGVEFLEEAIQIFPDAKRVLLTAYADTDVAIRAINKVGIDHYILKPWDPPEENFYPVLQDLLDAWLSSFRPPFEGVRVIDHRWSPMSHQVRDFLARNQIPYRWLDVEVSDEAKQYIDLVSAGTLILPLLVFPDGTTLMNPTSREIADKIGLKTRAENPFYDVIIIGGGPAGLAAGVYGASEGLRTVIIEKSAPGGQAGTSSRIENYLGFPVGLSGADLARRAVAQARRFGAEILTPQAAAGIRLEDPYRVLTLEDGTELSAHVILIATGVSYFRLDAPGVGDFTGAGVYYGAALSEALNYVGQDVIIVGAGNSAGQAAMYFSKYARTVFMLVRDNWLGKTMSQYLVNYIEATPNISVLVNHEVAAARGGDHLEEVDIVNNQTGEGQTIQTSALFIFIGAKPHTAWLGDLIERDAYGFIQYGGNGYRPRGWPLERDPYMFETNIPGIFVAGDARCGSVKRVATAVGEGAMAIQFIHKYLGGL